MASLAGLMKVLNPRILPCDSLPDGAYYMSGPSLRDNVQHAVIWKSLQLLKERDITLVELGQIDGETEKEKNIGKFKAGWGGEEKPFTIVRKKK